MKAISIQLPAQLSSIQSMDIVEPEIQADKVKVRWHAASLNYHDYAVCTGLMPTQEGRIPCSDAAGEIVEIGTSVREWQVGDHVISQFFPDWLSGGPRPEVTARISGDSCDGYATEYSVVAPTALTRMPRDYSFAEAATLPCAALTAWRALFEIGEIKAGDNVLVEGSGGVSMFALLMAKATGATVIATSSSAEKMGRLQELGADYTLNYHEDERWGETVFRLADGGVDHVVDIGGRLTLSQAINASRMGGNLVLVGILGGLECEINLAHLMLKQPRLSPIAVGNREMQIRMVDFLELHALRPVIDRVFPIEKIPEAMAYMVSGDHVGKIVLDI